MRRTGLVLLQEISVVRYGAVPGAEIIYRRELKPPPDRNPPAARSATLPRREVEVPGETVFYGGGIIRRPGSGHVIGVR